MMQITNYNAMKSNNFLPTPATRYTIYAYHQYCEDSLGYNKWQCLGNGDNALEILQEAQRLFSSAKFQKIEVKRKTFDLKKKRHLVSTWRVFDNKPKKNIFIAAVMVALPFLLFGLFLVEKL